MSNPIVADTLRRLDDVEQLVDHLRQQLKGRGDKIPGLVLARNMIVVDEVATRLADTADAMDGAAASKRGK